MGQSVTVRRTAVGIEWFEGIKKKSNMPKGVMVRKSENDDYVRFQPTHDSFPDWTSATIEIRDRDVYATIPELFLADLPIGERLNDEYANIDDPQSGEYYIFPNPVNVVFQDGKGGGFRAEYSALCILNSEGVATKFVKEMFDIPRGEKVNLSIIYGKKVVIQNASKYLKKPQSYDAICLLANRLFGNESQSALGAAAIIIDAINNPYDPINAEQLEDKLSEFFKRATDGGFNGSPQGAYGQAKDLKMISYALFGISFATYLSDKRITSVAWNHDQEMYIPYDNALDHYQEYAANYQFAEPVNVMDYLYSKVGDKVKFLPQASIDDCVTKADCDVLIGMLSNFM